MTQQRKDPVVDSKDPREVLSPREFQVFVSIAEGDHPNETATKLEISQKTVDTHRAHAIKKLGLRNNADVARAAVWWDVVRLPAKESA